MANIRSAYAEVSTAYLQNNTEKAENVTLVSNTKDWKSAEDAKIAGISAKDLIGKETTVKKSIEVKVDAEGKVTIGGQEAKENSTPTPSASPNPEKPE